MLFLFSYIKWHYTEAILDLIGIVKNFLWFFYELFSIPLLLKTFFTPFHRLGETYKKGGLHIENWLETFVVNTLMRIVGAFMRLLLIILGVFFIILTLFLSILFFIAWLLAPFLLILLLIIGIKFVMIG